MSEERITTVESNDGSPQTHTTVIRDESKKSGGGAGWAIAIILAIAVIGGIYLFSQSSASESIKDNAIAEAANEVGNAASQVGDAAQDAADAISK